MRCINFAFSGETATSALAGPQVAMSAKSAMAFAVLNIKKLLYLV